MRRMLIAIAAGLLPMLPAAGCMHAGYHGPQGTCRCSQKPASPKPDCPSRPDCPQQQAPAPPVK